MSVNAPPHGLLGLDDKDLSGPNAFSAHRGGGFRMRAQWGGHRGPAAGGRESREEKVESRHRGPRSRGAGSGPSDLCTLGREMSVDGGLGGPVAVAWGDVTMKKAWSRALWNPCRGSGCVGDGCPGVPLSRNPRLPS